MGKINVGIIFGGRSSEHEVSLRSATSIIENISKEKYNVYLIGITKEGKWLLFSGDISEIATGKWEKNNKNKNILISLNPEIRGIMIDDGGRFTNLRLDVVIPAMHGKNAEDGVIQGFFETIGIPYVGCRVLSSAVCMDKVCTNIIMDYFGIDKAKFHWFDRRDFEANAEKCINDTEKAVGRYPMFVKPANAGSSVGITKAKNREELILGIEKAIKEDSKILIEEGISGKEIECAVLGNYELTASVVGEIVPCSEFYDYDAKYLSSDSRLYIPARIPDDISKKVREIAKKAYKILDCRGLARIDFFVEDGTDKIYLNECNTFPGFTSISMYPKLMEETGIKFTDLIDKLITLAKEK